VHRDARSESQLARGAAGAADVPMLDLFAAAGVLALIVLPPATVFLPKLQLAPRVAMH
jgi:hypothetical protein